MFYYLLSIFLMLIPVHFSAQVPPTATPHTIAILGLGGRSQYLLLECMQRNSKVRVVAVCDDHGRESLHWFASSLQRNASPLFVQAYRKVFEKTYLYPDTQEGIKQLFKEHPQVDTVFITSSNDKHLKHLNAVLSYSECKHIYIEKPLFRTLEELQNFKVEKDDVTISVGLTLRYANMTKIIVDALHEYQTQLGALQKIKSWERLNFGHAMTIIMMNWRRHISLSGGLLLEKSIHDLDLGLFFMHALGVDPEEVLINTEVAHRFFKKSQKKKILKSVAGDEQLRGMIAGWSGVAFQRSINFVADKQGYVDVAGTIEKVFEGFPDNDNFTNSDIIPDYHKLTATCKTGAGNSVAFELEVDLGGLRLQSERGIQFEFERGTVLVDIMNSVMTITMKNGSFVERDLHTNNSGHAGGDAYIAQLILGVLPENRYRATLKDDVVQLATLMGLVSEKQAVGQLKKGACIKKGNENKWSLQ
jgi:hypothetical protein